MRKFTFIALILLCFTVSGNIEAKTTHTANEIELQYEADPISPELIEEILRNVSVEYGYDFSCLCTAYQKGTISIDKGNLGYTVAIQEDGGGLTILEIIEGI